MREAAKCSLPCDGECFAEETIATNVVAGVLSGAISSAVANPTDVLKVKGFSYCVIFQKANSYSVPLYMCWLQVRMQSGTIVSYSSRKSCLRHFHQIYQEEGLRGLYRVCTEVLEDRTGYVLILY